MEKERVQESFLMEAVREAKQAAEEIIEAAKLKKGQICVIGCSTSEILGQKIGSYSSPETAEAVFHAIHDTLSEKGIYLAAQCCEHLNRAVIIEREALPFYEEVNVIPQPKAGGSFATAAYKFFKDPIAIEEVGADAGLDIGGTLIGMHLKKVAVPVRLSVKKIGNAMLLAARVRPKFVGGSRAVYNEELL
ncbi:MAG: TIGR01440 family protein [Christensenellaceae bacterium]|nr:TIGR01440 family protein [Christensenellaceae bacterium]